MIKSIVSCAVHIETNVEIMDTYGKTLDISVKDSIW